MVLTDQSRLDSPTGGTKRKRGPLPLGSPPLRPNPPWNPKQDALSHLYESELADDYLIPLSRQGARCTIMEEEKHSEMLRQEGITHSKAENAQDKLFARLQKLSETLQRASGIEQLPLDKSESISKVVEGVIRWWDHASTAKEESTRKATEVQGELQKRYDLLLTKDSKQNKKIASLTRKLEEANRSKPSEAQGDLLNRYNSLLAKDSKRDEKIALLTRELEEVNQSKNAMEKSNRKTLDAQAELLDEYNSMLAKDSEQEERIMSLTEQLEEANQSKDAMERSNGEDSEWQEKLMDQYNSLLDKNSKRKEHIASLTKQLEEAKQSKHALKKSNRKASEAQDELLADYNSLLDKNSKQEETITSLTSQLKNANQLKQYWQKDAYSLQRNRDDLSVKMALHVQEKKKAGIELAELHKAHDTACDEAASLLADRDEKVRQLAKMEGTLKQCQLDLKQTKVELACKQAEWVSFEEEEIRKSTKLKEKMKDVEASLGKTQKELSASQETVRMRDQLWSATSHKNTGLKKQLDVAVKRSNDLQDVADNLRKQLADRKKEHDGRKKELADRKKELADQKVELDGERNRASHERQASKIRIADLKGSYNDAQKNLESMKEEYETEMRMQMLGYEEDRRNREMAAVANLETQLEQQRDSLREVHSAAVERIMADSELKTDTLLSCCKTEAANEATKLNRQLNEEKEKVSKLANEQKDLAKRTGSFQRELKASQNSLGKACETINQLCLIAVVLQTKNKASLTKREVILSKAIERAEAFEAKLTILQDEMNASKLALTTTRSKLKRKETEADARSKLLQETIESLAQLHSLHSACAQDRRFQLGHLNRQTLLADFSESTTLADIRRFKGEASGQEVEVCLGFLQDQSEALCLIQGVEDHGGLKIVQLAVGDCGIFSHCWKMWLRLGREKPLCILLGEDVDIPWMERYLSSGPPSSEDLGAIV